MKNNKLSVRMKMLLCSVLFAVLAASCANLPQVPTALPQDGPSGENPGTEGSGGEEQPVIPEAVNWEWSAPEAGPTVTPIVLPIEKRGEEGSLIVRSDVSTEEFEYEDSYDYSYIAPETAAEQSVPVSPAVGLKDEMAVSTFRPYVGSVVLPGQALHLDIVLKNTGTTTWQTSYKIIDISNIPMAAQKEFYLPYPVAPGDTVLVSVYMTAPTNLGSYPENFQIMDAYGVVFGSFDYSLTVGSFTSVTEIPTLPPTATPTYYSAEGITATPDELRWMCIDPERSKLQDCYQFCVEYSDREEFKYCYYDGVRYTTPVP